MTGLRMMRGHVQQNMTIKSIPKSGDPAVDKLEHDDISACNKRPNAKYIGKR